MIGMLAKVLEISLEAAEDWYLFLLMKLVLWLRVLVECLLAMVLVHMNDAWLDG